jgi:hypothetical protein
MLVPHSVITLILSVDYCTTYDAAGLRGRSSQRDLAPLVLHDIVVVHVTEFLATETEENI